MSKIISAFKQKDIRHKLLFTLLVLVIYRIGTIIPVPGIPFNALSDQVRESASNGAIIMMNLFAGGALDRLGILALGIMPYITASIIIQMLSAVIPSIDKLRKDGGEGRRRLISITRYLTVGIGIIEAIGYDLLFTGDPTKGGFGIQYSSAIPFVLSHAMVVFALVIGVVIIMWLGELITQHGIGNGMSVIIFTNVVSSVPSALVQTVQTSSGTDGIVSAVGAIVLIIVLLPLIVYVERSQRRVPVKSTKSGAQSRYARRASTSYIPIPWDVAGMFALIFSSTFITFISQILLLAFRDNATVSSVANSIASGPVSWCISFVLTILFFFYMAPIVFRYDDIAENLKNQGSYIPGVRPGQKTADYLCDVLNHLALFGSFFIAILAVVSSAVFYTTNNQLLQVFGGTSILIMVATAMYMSAQVEQSIRSSDPDEVLKRLGH